MLHNGIYLLRSSLPYQAVLRIGKRHVLPFLSAVFLLWLSIGTASHFLFNVLDSTGLFCHGTNEANLERLGKAGDHSTKDIVFTTNALCFATGVQLEHRTKYSVTIKEDLPWADNASQQAHPTHPSGFKTAELPHWWIKAATLAAMPFRRILFRRWFTVIARVGAAGVDEEFLDPRISGNLYLGFTGTVHRDGELFLYVNDAVIGLPWFTGAFYQNNYGTAHIIVTRQ